MNRCNTLATVLLASLTASASAGGHGTSGAPVQVHGYVKKDGTYVAPHYRSAPDGNFNNNWSTEGNVNPYTGEEGKLVTPPARPSTPGQLTAPAAPPALATTAQSPAVFVPTLPGEPIMMPAAKATPSPVSPSTQSIRSRASVPSFLEVQKAKDIERAKYWASRGHNFNPAYTSAFLMDQKVKDIERAQYWKSQGHIFNPDYVSAFLMDQKVKDIERARFWRGGGYDFNPEYMSAFLMDQKVRDFERAKYWRERGLNFDANYMSAFTMDQEAARTNHGAR